MPETRLIVELDGERLSDDDLRELGEVQAEEAADSADAAVLSAALQPAADGGWTSRLDSIATAETPVAIELSNGATSYRFDGHSAQAGWTIDPEAASQLQVKLQDRTLELDREEKVVAWPGTSDSAIAEAIFADHGMDAEVEPTPEAPDPDVHVTIQRETDLAFLRALARKWGYAVYLESAAGRTTGHFAPLDPLADPQGELSLGFGGDGRHVQVDAHLGDGRRVKAARIPPLSDTERQGDASGEDRAQGSDSLGGAATVLLTPEDVEGEVDPAAVAEGMARTAAFGVTLSAEVDAARIGRIVRARRTILVAGLGEALSGRYLVQRVRHVVTLERHAQQLTLVRNALGLSGDEPFGGGALGGLP